MGDKLVGHIGGQTGFPYWGTNRLHLLGDKQVALFGRRQLALMGDKSFALIGRTHSLPLLGYTQVAHIGVQTGCPYW